MTESEQIVYISCVEEVRYSFISHLSEALRRKGIHDVFVDSDDLLSNESQSKVERARVSVMVLPGNHTVNLDKLGEVLKCQKNKDQVVIPVLYGFRSEWLIALNSWGVSSVHYSRKDCSDSQFVKEIVRDVYEKLFYIGRIGIYPKLLEIEKMVCKQQLDIRCVGIWGMPGIGKTTLAKAVFDQMSGEFDAYCFIEDYTKAIQEKGLYCLLEEQFLKEKAVAGSTNTKLSLLREKLNNKRVLVVLDDVRNPLVVESFLGGFDWFGPKSLIIITSRDKQMFRLCRVNQVYEVHGLNEKEALQLFSLCASIDEVAEWNLHEVSMKVIKYANGHPLALSLYGRELKGKKRPPEMETAFLELKESPPNKFVDAIKSSYETLNECCRNIFLDIACFFKGENIDYVMQLLEGCGSFPHVGIDILVEKCLVTVSENRVCMHNLIQDVGRQIGRRSRLWEPWRITYLLEDNEQNADAVQGTEEIEGMFLDTSNLSFVIKPAAFDNMLNLRLLKIYCSNPEIRPVISFPDGYIRSLPNELRLLHWENYPLQFLPVNFDPTHLVEINMPYSQLCRLWDGTKNLEMLRTIRLCHSQQLVDIDDLLKAPNLEVIDLQGCTRLQSFPATGHLLHLRVVNLSGCTEIKNFPEIPPNIETLHLQGTGITELPLSIVKPNYRELLNLLAEIPGLSGVSNLEQSDLKPLTSLMKIGTSDKNLGKLIRLELNDCSRLRSLPDMDNLELIKVLDLSGCLELETIQGFPRNLKELYLARTAVRQVPQLPQSLELFNAHGCVSLKSIRLNFEKLPAHYTFSNCFDLSAQVVSDFLLKALANAQHILRERQELNEALAFSLCVPSHANLKSTLDLQPGSSVMTQLNPSWRNTLVGFAMLVEVAFSEDYCDATGFGIRCVCKWKNKEGHSHRIERDLHCWAPGKAVPKVQKDHIFVFCDLNMHPSTDEGNDPDICADLVVFEFFPVNKQTKPLAIVTRCGVRVITGNTSRENVLLSPVLSLDPMEVSGNENEEVLRISYDGLQEIGKALFLYIACLFNDEDVGLVAPLTANIIDMDVSYGLNVLANRSLIPVSSNGEIVMSCFLRQMGQEILHTESKKTERLGNNSMINTKKIERKRKVKNVVCEVDVGSQSGEGVESEPWVWQKYDQKPIKLHRKQPRKSIDNFFASSNLNDPKTSSFCNSTGTNPIMDDCRFESSELQASFLMSTPIFSDSWTSCNAANCAGSIQIQHIAGIMYVAIPAVPMTQLGVLVDLKAAGDGLFPSLASDEPLPMVDAAILNLFRQLKIKEGLELELVGKKLVVITGHSTGGALAALTALWLLSQPSPPSFRLICITFGSTLLGNQSLSSSVSRSRLAHNFCHVVSIHDHVPRSSNEQFWPFGSYLLCSENGGVCLDNAESVRRMFNMLNATGTPNIEAHQRYGHYVSTLSHMFLKSRSFLGGNISDNSYEAGVTLAVEALGFSSDDPRGVSVKECIETSTRIGRAPILRSAELANDLASVLPARLEIQWYKDRCDASEEQLGYYDFFKRYSLKRDFKVNMSRKRLAMFWDRVFEMVETNELPFDFHLGKKWIYASQFYQLLAEPLDIAHFYKHRDLQSGGHYLDQGNRPKRYEVIDKWWKQGGEPEECVRSRYTSTTQDTCFWAKLEEAKEWLDEVRGDSIDAQRRSWLWENIDRFESYADKLVKKKEVSVDVLAKRSSYTVWVENLGELKFKMGYGNRIEMVVDESDAMET